MIRSAPLVRALRLIGFGLALGLTVPAQAHEVAEPSIIAERQVQMEAEGEGVHAEVGLLPVRAADGGVPASAGYIAYTRPGSVERPVLFAFNGGPGASSAFLHMGVLGPFLVDVPGDPAAEQPAQYDTTPAPSALLTKMDVVLIDPPGTGFSQGPASEDAAYRSVSGDAAANAALLREWLERNGRTASPVYILGESYGTIRAVAMLEELAGGDAPILPRGVILLGQALNMIETSQRPDNVVTYPVSLPSLAAIACYFGKVAQPCDPRDQAQAASDFADEYLLALFKGAALPEPRARQITARLEELSGIPASFYLANDLRISKERFRVELLRDEGAVTGRYDARYTAPRPKGDPVFVGPDAFSPISDRMSAAIVPLLRNRLGVANADDYRIIARMDGEWSYGGADSPFSDWPFMTIVEQRADADPCLRLFVGTGLYDLTTTVGAADYLFAQSELPANRWENRVYAGGHVFYSDREARDTFLADLVRFVDADGCR